MKSKSLIILDGCSSHENNIATLVLEFAKGTLMLLYNLTEAVVTEMIGVQLNCHSAHLNNTQNDQRCKMLELGCLTHYLRK